MNKLFKGIMPAMITPVFEDGTLNRAAAEKIMAHEMKSGIQGFYVNGATGEGLFLSEKTRMEMIECAKETVGGKGVLINHVGAVDSQAAIRLAKHAGEIKADAISSLVPNYINKYTTEQILDYYKRISDASGLPVLVYCTNLVGADPFGFMEKAIKVDGVIGCKYTMFDYYSMHRIVELNDGDINVINGPDEMLICGLTMGADGGIGSTYNVMPERYVQMYKAFTEGDFEKARRLQFGINKVISVILKHGCIPTIKEILNIEGFNAGNVVDPVKKFDEAERKELIEDLVNAGYPING